MNIKELDAFNKTYANEIPSLISVIDGEKITAEYHCTGMGKGKNFTEVISGLAVEDHKWFIRLSCLGEHGHIYTKDINKVLIFCGKITIKEHPEFTKNFGSIYEDLEES